MFDQWQKSLSLARPSVQQWLKSGLVGKDPATIDKISDAIIDIQQHQLSEAPLYLRALTGIGAVISGLLFLFLLNLLGLFQLTSEGMALNGLVLMIVGALLYRRGLEQSALTQDFLVQSALTLNQAGKIAAIWGLVGLGRDHLDLDDVWLVTLIIAAIGAFSFLLYQSSLERFIATLAPAITLWIAILTLDDPTHVQRVFVSAIVLHLAFIALYLYAPWLRRHAYGMIEAILISLCIAVGLVATEVPLAAMYFGSNAVTLGNKWPVQLALTIALMALILWVAGNGKNWKKEPVIAACAGALALAFLSDPGILLALGLMVLGQATARPLYAALGVAFAIIFGVHFYYALDLTLLEKSLILVASGLVCLAGAAYIHRRRWHEPPDTINPAPAQGGDHA